MDSKITFDQLPAAVNQVQEKLNRIEVLLNEMYRSSNKDSDQLLNVSQAAEFLQLAVPTIYSMISRGELPYMKRSKRIYFSQIDLLEYLKAGRRKTTAEIELETSSYLTKRKKG